MNGNIIYRRRSRQYTETEKREVIDYFLSHDYTKSFVWKKFIGDSSDHGQILRWMRQLDYDESLARKIYYIGEMSNVNKNNDTPIKSECLDESSRIEELKKQLSEAELRAEAYLKMVEIAELEFKISIRKKYNTKPLVK